MKPQKIHKTKWLTTSCLVAAMATSTALGNEGQYYGGQSASTENETKWYNPATWFRGDSDTRERQTRQQAGQQGGQRDIVRSGPADQSGAQASSQYIWNEEANQWERDPQAQPQQDRAQQGMAQRGQQGQQGQQQRGFDQQDQPQQGMARTEHGAAQRDQQQRGQQDQQGVAWSEQDQERAHGLDEREGGVAQADRAGQRDQAQQDQDPFGEDRFDSADRPQTTQRDQGLQQDQAAQRDQGVATAPLEREQQMGQRGQQQEREGYATTRNRSAPMGQQDDITRQVELDGIVENYESASIEGVEDSDGLVSIQLTSGQTLTLDLGPEASLDELELESGNAIRIVGSSRDVAGQEVIQAEHIYLNGETTPAFSYRQR